MKKHIISLLLGTSLIMPPAFALEGQSAIAHKIQQTQELLTKMNQDIGEFGTCVLQGTCSSEKQKKLSNSLKGAAAALGTFMLDLVAAAKTRIIGEPKESTVPRT